MSIQGYLVNVGKFPKTVFPSTPIVNHKDGSKSFYFYDNGKPLLAKKTSKEVAFKVN
jgi:hypothetical protein